jgi:ABC-type glycerol-3-phosphate transport system permease component
VWGLAVAGILTTIPIMIFTFLAQNNIVKGLTFCVLK